MAERGKAAVNAMSILGNTQRGFTAKNLRTVYKASVYPVLSYASPVWYNGKGQKGLVKQLNKVQNIALRRIAGAFRTTKISALEIICSVPPLQYSLERENELYAQRLHKLHHTSAIAARLGTPWRNHIPGYSKPPLYTKAKTNLRKIQELGTPDAS
jgi:hypothetical protein